MEEEGLLPSFPTLRPGDVTLHRSLDPLSSHINHKPPVTAIDCTMILSLPLASLAPTSLAHATATHAAHHIACKGRKYNRPPQKLDSTSICGATIITALKSQNITLFAFTFDDFG